MIIVIKTVALNGNASIGTEILQWGFGIVATISALNVKKNDGQTVTRRTVRMFMRCVPIVDH